MRKLYVVLEISKFFVQGRGYTCTLSPIIHGLSLKKRKPINEMDGNIPGGSFPKVGGGDGGEGFPGESLMGGNFPGGQFS